MIICNITTHIHWDTHERWIKWIKEEQLPGMMATGIPVRYQFVRLLENDETEGPTYALQFYFEDHHRFAEFKTRVLPGFHALEQNNWGEKVFSFSSLLEIID